MKAVANRFSMYLVPIGYVVLIIYLSLSLSIVQVLTVLLALVFGIWLGDKVNDDLILSKRFGKIQYDRHPLILLVWLIALAIRIYVELFFKVNIAVFIMTSILAISTGTLISESLSLRIKIRRRQGQR